VVGPGDEVRPISVVLPYSGEVSGGVAENRRDGSVLRDVIPAHRKYSTAGEVNAPRGLVDDAVTLS
jgi:hypothetical protein